MASREKLDEDSKNCTDRAFIIGDNLAFVLPYRDYDGKVVFLWGSRGDRHLDADALPLFAPDSRVFDDRDQDDEEG